MLIVWECVILRYLAFHSCAKILTQPKILGLAFIIRPAIVQATVTSLLAPLPGVLDLNDLRLKCQDKAV